MQPWIQKHKPSSSKDVVGQEKSIQQILEFVQNYKKQKKKALLLYGPTGSGKTSAVVALAKELDLELLEINASDTRNSAAMESILGNAVGQQSLFSQGKIILVDEADGLSGTKDRGALPTLLKVIAKSAFPIIITLENPHDRKYSSLTKKCVLVPFEALSHAVIFTHLENIAKKENITFEEAALQQLSRMADGDMRAAINDLQVLSTHGNLDKKSIEHHFQREKKETIETALFKIFKGRQLGIVLPAFDQVQVDLDKIFLWMDENIPKQYTKPQDVSNAYDALSKADVFFGRIRRWQYYRFYVYCYALVSAGVALAKEEKYAHSPVFQESKRILKIWIANQKNFKKKSIATKLAEHTHASTKRALEDVLYLKALAKHQDITALADTLELSNEEIDWLKA